MFDDLLIRKENCCVPQETEINTVRRANAYVPMQRLCETFEPLHGLRHGTIFPPLVSDYVGKDRRFGLYDD